MLDALDRSEVVTRVVNLRIEHHGAVIAEVLLPQPFVEEYGKEQGIVVVHHMNSVPPTLTVDTSIRDFSVPTVASARAIAGGISSAGTLAALPSVVDIHQYCYAVLDPTGTNVLVAIADDDPFESMVLGVSGSNGFYTGTQDQAWVTNNGGWHRAVFSFPVADLDLDYTIGVPNTLDVDVYYENPATGEPTKYDASWTFAFTVFP